MKKTTIIGARTRSLRENRNWSQEDLARESGLKRPHISLIETGDRMPGAETLVTACPWCERNFLDAISTNGARMKVYDIVELVQQAI